MNNSDKFRPGGQSDDTPPTPNNQPPGGYQPPDGYQPMHSQPPAGGPQGYGGTPEGDQWGGMNVPDAWVAGEPQGFGGSKPPIIPFTPVDMGQLFSGTFAAIRANPKVMFTISLVTMGFVGLLAGLVAAFSGPEVVSSFSSTDSGFEFEEVITGADTVGGTVATTVLDLVVPAASLLVMGALVLVVTNAVIGRNLDLSATVDLLKGRIWKLIGAAILVWLVMFGVGLGLFLVAILFATAFFGEPSGGVLLLGVVFLLAVVGVIVWLGVRLYYATMVAVVEEASPRTALRRSWELTRGAFWRTFGRLLVVQVLVGLISGVLGAVVGFIVGIGNPQGSLLAFLTVFATALVSGLVAPISASYSALMYVDERMRTENLGPVLENAWLASR